MHSVLLLTALTATSGLFGGGRQCTSGNCGSPAVYYTYAPRYYNVQAPCATCPASAPQAAPVPQAAAPAVQPAAVPQAPAAPVGYYYGAGYYYPTAATCPTGNCPYR